MKVVPIVALLCVFNPGATLALLQFCGKLDLTFILDQSESLRDDDPYDQPDYTWGLVKSFVKGLVNKLSVSEQDIHVAMVKYSTNAKIEWNLGQYLNENDLLSAIDRLQCEGGNTNTADALRLTYDEIYMDDPRSHARNVVVIFTDGLSTIKSNEIKFRVNKLIKKSDAEIYAVAVGKYVDDYELKDIVYQRFGKYLIYVPDYDNLPAFLDLIAHRVCGLPDPDPPTGKKCERIMDLTFIVDSSGSINARNFRNLKAFLTLITENLEIAPDKTRVATVRFSDNATLVFGLGDYTNKENLEDKLIRLRYENGNTNMSGAIRTVVRQVYSGNIGDRPDVADVVILVTDGESTVEKKNTIKEARIAKDTGIRMYVIGVTDKVNVGELQQIVSPPIQEHYFDSTHVVYLKSILINLIKNICEG